MRKTHRMALPVLTILSLVIGQTACIVAPDQVITMTASAWTPIASDTPIPTPTGGGAGLIAFVGDDMHGNQDIYLMNSDGSKVTKLTNDMDVFLDLAWSPDGKHLVFTSVGDHDMEIYTINSNGEAPNRLTYHRGNDQDPTWSPDGKLIAFAAEGNGKLSDIFVMNKDGSNRTNLSRSTGRSEDMPSWSPHGDKIVYTGSSNFDHDIYIMNSDGSHQVNLTNNPSDDWAPAWSPDGKRIAFWSLRNTEYDLILPKPMGSIYVMDFDGYNLIKLTEELAVSGDFATLSWSPDGRWLSFECYDYELCLLDVEKHTISNVSQTSDTLYESVPAWQP